MELDYSFAEEFLKKKSVTILDKWVQDQKKKGDNVIYLMKTLRCNGVFNDFHRGGPEMIGVCTIHMVSDEVDLLGVLRVLPNIEDIEVYPFHMD